jgi:hypothetical protein
VTFPPYEGGEEPSKPSVRRGLFKKIDTTATVERVAAAIDAALLARPDVQELRWWSTDEAGA